MSGTNVCVVLISAPSHADASELAYMLVTEGLAACVNLIPGVRSVYRWEGRIFDDPEVLMVVKTTLAAFDALKARVLAKHRAKMPEILRLEVADGHVPYLDWVRESVR